MTGIVELPETEPAYRIWLHDHPHGFVMNAWRDPTTKPESTKGVTWHRADCSYLAPERPEDHVAGATIKACSTDLGALTMWAIRRGEPVSFCKDCRSRWMGEQP
jgi:hypothetical protein